MSLINTFNLDNTQLPRPNIKPSVSSHAYEQPQLYFDSKVKRLVVPLYCGTCRAYGCQCFLNSYNQLSNLSIHFTASTASDPANFPDNNILSSNSIQKSNQFYNTSTSGFSPVHIENYKSYLNINNNVYQQSNPGLLNSSVNNSDSAYPVQQQLFTHINRQHNLINGSQDTTPGVEYQTNNSLIFSKYPNKQENLSAQSLRHRKNMHLNENIEKKFDYRHSSIVDSFYFNGLNSNNSGLLAQNKPPGGFLNANKLIESEKNMSSHSFSSNTSNVDSANFKDSQKFKNYKNSNANQNVNKFFYFSPTAGSSQRQMCPIKVIYQGYDNKKFKNNKNAISKNQNKPSVNSALRNKKFAAYESILSSSQQTSTTSSSLSSSPTPLLDHFSTNHYSQSNGVKPYNLKQTLQQTAQVPCRLGIYLDFF